MSEIDSYKTENKEENPYLILDFWHFAIISTLMVALFPFSLLFCVLFFGLEETKLIVIALIHDAVKTLLAVLLVLVSLIVVVLVLVFLISSAM